jgi:hypothetical protein
MITGASLEGMMVDSVERVPHNETDLVSRLLVSLKHAMQRQRDVPAPYLPGADWKRLLESQWRRYDAAMERQNVDAAASLLRNFFRNEGLSGFWGGERMFESFAALDGPSSLQRADLMRRQLEAWRLALPATAFAELDAPLIGNPWGYLVAGALLYEPVCEYHYQAHYFASLLSEIIAPVILEIGGGFGGLAYHLIKRMPNVTYIGFDLPQNALLQSYYLSCAFPELRVLVYEEGMTALTREHVANYDILILPNFMIPLVDPEVADLIVNVRSLSEMPADTIAEYHRQIDRLGPLFFFHENIFKKRTDGFHGIPSSKFPKLQSFVQVAGSESRWPRYNAYSTYPCRENLFVHCSALTRRRHGSQGPLA